MDFTAPSFSLGFDFDDDDAPPPAPRDRREQPRGYAAPDPPSFSLGIESDDDFEAEPQIPAGGRREELVRRSAAPDPPSFSLGIDDDDDMPLAGGQRREQARPQVAAGAPSSTGVEEDDDDFVPAAGKRPVRVGRQTIASDPLLPPLPETNRLKRLRKGPAPPHPAPTLQARRCEAPDAPSFSLGISDSDNDDGDVLACGQHHQQSRPQPQATPRVASSLGVEEEDDFFLAGDRRPEPAWRETSRLKRLRKGPAPPRLAPTPPPLKVPEPPAAEVSPVMNEKATLGALGTGSSEDEIEDWTTDEERPVRDVPPSVGSCSKSKFSLLNQGVLMTQSAKTSKVTQKSDFSASKSLEESCKKKLLPKITISPMRKIHLLDSDTDVEDDQNQNKTKKPVSPSEKRQESMHKDIQKEPALLQTSKAQGSMTAQKSEVKMNDNWVTPAFDDFCNEYFKSMTDARPSQQKEDSSFRCTKVSQPMHSISETEGHIHHQSTSSGTIIDENLNDSSPPAVHYFFHHDPMVRDLVRGRLQHFVPMGAQSTRENEQSGAESLSCRRQFGSSAGVANGWVTPNIRTSIPTDVGKKRVHPSGTQSGSGHWFTDEGGKKVYVTKNGQELTGRQAYRQYQKESGRRYKKKGSSGTKRGAPKAKKATTAAKQGTSRAKRKR